MEKRESLRHLETVRLAPTKGDVLLAEAEDVFTGWIATNFKKWGMNVSSEGHGQRT